MRNLTKTRAWLYAFALAASLGGTTSWAADEAEAAPAEAEPSNPNKRVCRDAPVTGSHVRQRVCLKQKEWDRLREQSQEAMRKVRPDFTVKSEN